MKHLTITILSILFSISATAQEADTTAANGDKLNFEQPRFLVSDYFSSVKAHLSKEGRKGWKPEFPVLPGDWKFWGSWQPGIAFHLWGKSNFFIGLSIGPTIGAHAGIAL